MKYRSEINLSVELPAREFFLVHVFHLDNVLAELSAGQREGRLLGALSRVVLHEHFACQGEGGGGMRRSGQCKLDLDRKQVRQIENEETKIAYSSQHPTDKSTYHHINVS